MLGQTKMSTDGQVLDRVEMAIKRLQAFCPEEGYYVAFSGGKDSQCVYHLCKMAGVKFDAHYNVTSVDPPELVRFIKQHYPDVKFEHHCNRDGKPSTMWSLIPEQRMPPTRLARYCCSTLKESSGKGRYTVTGVRAQESTNRKQNQGVMTVMNAGEKLKEVLEENDVNFTKTPRGGGGTKLRRFGKTPHDRALHQNREGAYQSDHRLGRRRRLGISECERDSTLLLI